MGQAISDVLPFAIGVAISPVPIIAVMAVLFLVFGVVLISKGLGPLTP